MSILIDGGPSQTYQSNLKPTLDKFLVSNRLDLVILSHIDNDHILGLLDLFETIKRESGPGSGQLLKIADLWHNSFSDLITSSDAKKLLQELFLSNHTFAVKIDNKLSVLPALGALKGVSEGRDLTKLAQYLHIPINRQVGGNLVATNDGHKAIEVANIKFHILGPTQKNLEKLRKTWNSWIRNHTQVGVRPADYEALQLLDASITNLSSIMFMVEFESKKLLFTGDGLGKDVLDNLSEKQMLDSEGKLHVDILKVPHHGSERNVSEQFFQTVTADIYVISANGRDDNPSFSTLKWIIESGMKNDRKLTIVATNNTENIEKARQMYDPNKYHYRFSFLDQGANFLELDAKNNFTTILE